MLNHDENRPRTKEEIDFLLNARKRVADKDKLFTTKGNKVVVDHVQTANVMLKFIMTAPVDDLIKEIMVLRIGNPLINERPLTHLAIALKLGLNEAQVFQMEMQGVKVVSEYMEKVTAQEGVDEFNKNSDLRNDIEDTFNKL